MDKNAKIDSIPDEEIKKAIESFNPITTYVKDSYIDLYDHDTWRVAIITEISNNLISIHFEGWGPRYDEKNIKMTEFRVAPFRRYTKGYTGQVKDTYRHFIYNNEKKNFFTAQLLELLQNSFVIEDPLKFIQSFRGDIFFFTDALLTSLSTSPPSEEAIPEIIDFLKLYMKVIVEWMKMSWDFKEEFETAEKWSNLYAVHGRTSVAMAYAELVETLINVFGGSPRTIVSFQILCGHSQDGLDEILNSKKAKENMVILFYKEFKQLGGFEEILKMITQ